MGMPHGELTFERVEKNFNRFLDNAINSGVTVDSNSGLDEYVRAAINQVAKEYPNVTAISIQSAQQNWRRQVSGATVADRAAGITAALAARGIT